MKTCTRCCTEKPVEEFYRQKKAQDGRAYECRTCFIGRSVRYKQKNRQKINEAARQRRLRDPQKARDATRLWRQNNPESARRSRRQTKYRVKYGMTIEQFESMRAAQGEVCAICQKPAERQEHLYVDHDHATGEVRGLLCRVCNFQLGVIENFSWLKSAAEYLSRAKIVKTTVRAVQKHGLGLETGAA